MHRGLVQRTCSTMRIAVAAAALAGAACSISNHGVSSVTSWSGRSGRSSRTVSVSFINSVFCSDSPMQLSTVPIALAMRAYFPSAVPFVCTWVLCVFCSFVSSCAQHAANGYAARLIADCPTWRLPAAQCCTLRRARGTRACHAVRSSGTSRKMVSVQQSQHHRLVFMYPRVRVCACWWRLGCGASSRARPLAPAVCQASSAPGRRGGTEWRCIVPPLRLLLLIWSCSSPEHQIIFRAAHVYTQHTGCQCLLPSCLSRSSRGKDCGFATQT